MIDGAKVKTKAGFDTTCQMKLSYRVSIIEIRNLKGQCMDQVLKWETIVFLCNCRDIKMLMKWVHFSLQHKCAIFCKAPKTGYDVTNGLNAYLNIVMLLFIVYTEESYSKN